MDFNLCESFHLQQAWIQKRSWPMMHWRTGPEDSIRCSSHFTCSTVSGRFCCNGSFIRYMSRATPLHLADITSVKSMHRNFAVASMKCKASMTCCADVAPDPVARILHSAEYSWASDKRKGYNCPSALKHFSSLSNDDARFCNVDATFILKQSRKDCSMLSCSKPDSKLLRKLVPSCVAKGSCKMMSRNLDKALHLISSSRGSRLARLSWIGSTGAAAGLHSLTGRTLTTWEFKTSKAPSDVGVSILSRDDTIVPCHNSRDLNTEPSNSHGNLV